MFRQRHQISRKTFDVFHIYHMSISSFGFSLLSLYKKISRFVSLAQIIKNIYIQYHQLLIRGCTLYARFHIPSSNTIGSKTRQTSSHHNIYIRGPETWCYSIYCLLFLFKMLLWEATSSIFFGQSTLMSGAEVHTIDDFFYFGRRKQTTSCALRRIKQIHGQWAGKYLLMLLIR